MQQVAHSAPGIKHEGVNIWADPESDLLGFIAVVENRTWVRADLRAAVLLLHVGGGNACRGKGVRFTHRRPFRAVFISLKVVTGRNKTTAPLSRRTLVIKTHCQNVSLQPERRNSVKKKKKEKRKPSPLHSSTPSTRRLLAEVYDRSET